MIRQPIIAVLGHVDHGKTTLLDKIRSTTIATKEVGGLTQHIGASEVPIDAINKISGPLLKAMNVTVTIPGLLFIDTPGHEVFTNLRRRGGNISDIAILVVDITQGFEPQTIEAVEILKEYKTPFVVAANKIDLLTGWHDTKSKSFLEALSKQNSYVADAIENRLYTLMGSLSEFGLNAERFDRIKDFKTELALVPVSAKTGEGIAELLMLITGLAQRYLEEKLKIEIKGPGKGSILEKNEIRGLGTTIDIILYDGSLRVNDTIAFATSSGVATSRIRALLKPKPLHQMGAGAGKFMNVDAVSAASGIKISGEGLDDAMPGSPIVQVTEGYDYTKEIKSEISEVFKTDPVGVVLKTDSIGSMEAISMLLGSAGFKISKKGIGSVTKRDIVDAFSMNAKDPACAAVLAFNSGMDPDVLEASQTSGVKVISNNIIYKLLDDYSAFVAAHRKTTAEKAESTIVFPAAIEVMPGTVFRMSHPAIFGVRVLAGRIKQGYKLINELGIFVGKIKEMQNEKAPVPLAKKGDQIAISMTEPTFGRQVNEGQTLYTDVRDSDRRLLSKEFANLIDDDERRLMERILAIKSNARE
jgi:translation initiation factor 5B